MFLQKEWPLQAGHDTAAAVLVGSLGSNCDGHKHLLDTFQLCILLFFTLCDALFLCSLRKDQSLGGYEDAFSASRLMKICGLQWGIMCMAMACNQLHLLLGSPCQRGCALYT